MTQFFGSDAADTTRCGGRVAAAVAQAPGTDRLLLGTVDLVAKTGALIFTSALEIHLSLLVRRARLAKPPPLMVTLFARSSSTPGGSGRR